MILDPLITISIAINVITFVIISLTAYEAYKLIRQKLSEKVVKENE